MLVVKLTCTETAIVEWSDDSRDTYRHVAYEAKQEFGRIFATKERSLVFDGVFTVPKDMVGSFRSKYNYIDWNMELEVYIPNNKKISRDIELKVEPRLYPFAEGDK